MKRALTWWFCRWPALAGGGCRLKTLQQQPMQSTLCWASHEPWHRTPHPEWNRASVNKHNLCYLFLFHGIKAIKLNYFANNEADFVIILLTSSSGPTSSLLSTSLVCRSKMSRFEGTLGACRCCSLSRLAALLACRAWHSFSSVERVAGQPFDPDATPHPLPWDFTGLLPLTGSS